MAIGNQRFAQGWVLRASGLLLLVIGALAMRHLFQTVHHGSRTGAALAETGLAALGFVSLSSGSALTCLGAQIFDTVEIAERWRRWPAERVHIALATASSGFALATGTIAPDDPRRHSSANGEAAIVPRDEGTGRALWFGGRVGR